MKQGACKLEKPPINICNDYTKPLTILETTKNQGHFNRQHFKMYGVYLLKCVFNLLFIETFVMLLKMFQLLRFLSGVKIYHSKTEHS